MSDAIRPGETELDAELLSALEALAVTEHLLVALDFDGTLAPPADDPDDARSLPAARAAALELVSEPGVTVALVSGRSIDSLQRVTNAPPEVIFSGSHGTEFFVDGQLTRPALSAAQRASLDDLRLILERVSDDVAGSWVESKSFGYALHTRLTLPDDAAAADARALAEASVIEGLTVREGKHVLEFSITATTKADALRHLRGLAGATAVFFAGDDVTDEDGFAALTATDVGLKVGEPPTRAAHTIASLEHMPAVLSALVEFRRSAAARI